nr:hypothetical protein CFP56_04047 [Quercus suber]
MTKSRNQSGRAGRNSQPPRVQVFKHTQSASTRLSELPSSRRTASSHEGSAQLLPMMVGRCLPPPELSLCNPVVSPSFNLDMLVDTRRLSIPELDRLRNEIMGRDSVIAELQRAIETQSRTLSELSELLATRQRTITNQKESNTATLKALANQKRSSAETHRVVGQLRRDISTLRGQLKRPDKETTKAVTHHVQAKRSMQPVIRVPEPKQCGTVKAAVNYPKKDAPTDPVDAPLLNTASEVKRLRQELALAATRHQAALAELERRESLAQEQLEEAEAAIAISNAKMPELIEKASQVDRLMRDLHTRDNLIEDLSSLVGESCAADGTQSELTRAALDRQTLIHDLVVQDYIEQIRELTAQKSVQETKADKAISFG